MAKYQIGSEVFSSQEDVRKRCRGILAACVSGPIREPRDVAFVAWLLARHRQVKQKVGQGVVEFFSKRTEWGTRCFYLRRVDGTETDFSFEACIKPPSARTEAMKAFRSSVRFQVLDFKNEAFRAPVTSALSGLLLTANTAHVDHAPPWTFLRIVEEFVASKGLSYEDVEVNTTDDNSVVTELTDLELSAQFAVYHRERAVFRMISEAENLSLPKR